MSNDELLAKIGNPVDEGYQYADIVFNKALRAVVELHKPKELDDGEPKCMACETADWYKVYPCPTIQAIEKELKNGI